MYDWGKKWGKVGRRGEPVANPADVIFLGEFEHALDDKGRLTVPSKLRPGLGDTFVVTRGLEECLFAYPVDAWQRIAAGLQAVPFTDQKARTFGRFFFGGAEVVSTDRQGRFLVPPMLRKYAGLEKDTVVVGVSDRVEVWSKQRWEQFCLNAASEYEEAAEHLFRGKDQ